MKVGVRGGGEKIPPLRLAENPKLKSWGMECYDWFMSAPLDVSVEECINLELLSSFVADGFDA